MMASLCSFCASPVSTKLKHPSGPGPTGNSFYFRVCGASTSSYTLTRVKGFQADLTFSEDQAFFMQ